MLLGPVFCQNALWWFITWTGVGCRYNIYLYIYLFKIFSTSEHRNCIFHFQTWDHQITRRFISKADYETDFEYRLMAVIF